MHIYSMKTRGRSGIVAECVLCLEEKWAVLLHKMELFIIFTVYCQ